MKQIIFGTIALATILGSLYVLESHNKKPESNGFGIEHETYLKSLEKIISEINLNKSKHGWTAGVNPRWERMNLESIKKQMGVLPQKSDSNLPVVGTVSANLPASYDPRTVYPNCESLKEIRDQSTCGSCWAFSSAQVMSDRICIASKETRQDRISTEDILTCCTSCGNGCNGGYPEEAFNFYLQTGVVSGDLFGDQSWCQPYSLPPCDHHTTGKYNPCGATVKTPSCSKTCNAKYWRGYKADQSFAQTVYNVASDQNAIMTEILTHGPVSAAFTVFDDFLTYKTGVYKHITGNVLGGHAVKIIGWGNEDGIPYWLIVNSWNEDWGDQGTFKMLRGYNECGIQGEIVTGLPML